MEQQSSSTPLLASGGLGSPIPRSPAFEFTGLMRKAARRLRRATGQPSAVLQTALGHVPPVLRVSQEANEQTAPVRIIFLLPWDNSPIGGNKVSYRAIESITAAGVDSRVLHPEKPGAVYTWFFHSVRSLTDGHINPRSDFLVLPEIWAALGASFCIPNGIRYAIFVQNGYVAHGFDPRLGSSLAAAYRGADLVLTISTDTSDMVRLLYPFVPAARLQRMRCSVPDLFGARSRGPKEKLITYMPRKLREHTVLLAASLRNTLPADWRLESIEDRTEQQVAECLARSSIFLSFSQLEGYGLPPVEAALSGNIVVGYTGQGGREYFRPPIFREIQHGDFLGFAAAISAAISDVGAGRNRGSEYELQRSELLQTHSPEVEQAHLEQFTRRVQMLMATDAAAVAHAERRA